MSLSPGDIIDGKYRIVRLLGEGGMGVVFEGENTRIHRRVAIKVLHAAVAATTDAVQRFEREAQAAGRIGSEHIVGVLDLGELPTGERYMVMEYLEGESLTDRVRRAGTLDPTEIVPLARQLLDGLAAAHGAGIIHRDLKPDNIYLLTEHAGRKDFVKILDFGISKFNALSGDGGFSMTRTGSVMGTPYYMSPEQAKGDKAMDHRSDLYSVGVILYECASGTVPFNAETFNELLFKIVLETATPLAERVPGLDPDFSALVARSMSRDVNERFADARAFSEALAKWAETGRASAPAPRAATVQNAPAPRFQGTQQSWAQTGETRTGRRKGLLVGGIAAATLVVGGAVGAILLSGGSTDAGLEGTDAAAAAAPVIAAEALAPAGTAPATGVSAAAPDAAPTSVGATPGVAPAGTHAATPESATAAKPAATKKDEPIPEGAEPPAEELKRPSRGLRVAPKLGTGGVTPVKVAPAEPAPTAPAPKPADPAHKTDAARAEQPSLGKAGNRQIRVDLD